MSQKDTGNYQCKATFIYAGNKYNVSRSISVAAISKYFCVFEFSGKAVFLYPLLLGGNIHSPNFQVHEACFSTNHSTSYL